MAKISWLRLWHDMVNDPKWRTIARTSGQSISVVQSVWLQLLVSASEAEDRGTYSITEEDIASSLNESDETVFAVINAMQGRVLDGKHLTGWEKRQPNRDDATENSDGVANKNYGSRYLYYVVNKESDVVRVGISSNPWARIKDFKAGSTAEFKLLAALKTHQRSDQEIRDFFHSTHLGGGWFRRDDVLNSLIKKTASKEIDSFEKTIEYLSASSVDCRENNYVATVATVATTKDKDKDTDKDTDTEKSNSNSFAFAQKKIFEPNPDPMSSETNSNPNQTRLDVGEVMSPTADVVDLQKTGNGASRALGVSDLVADGIPRQYAEDWLRVRNAKRAPLTQTAWLAVKTEAAKAGITPAEAVLMSAVNSWQGFKAAWCEKLKLSEVKPGALPTNGTHSGYAGRHYGKGGLI